MSGLLRFDQLEPARQDAIRKNLDVMHTKNAPDADVESYLRDVEHLAPATPKEGLGTRVIHNVGNAVKQLRHPLDMVGNMAKGALEDLGTVASSMNAGMGQPSDLTPERAKEVPGAMLRTGVNLALPGIAGGATKLAAKAGAGSILSHITGAAAAGGAGGAAYTPDDPVAGGIAGALLGPAFAGAAKGVGRLAGKVGSAAVDVAGRPVESRPVIQAGPVKFGNIEGVGDKAARLNAQGLERANFFTDTKPDFTPNDKPIAPVDQNTRALRMARGLKTSSPAAETELRSALEPRTEGGVERVIGQAKDLTGIKRADAYETHQQLKERTTAEGDAAYGKVWKSELGKTVRHQDLQSVLSRPAVKHALPAGAEIMANSGIETPPSGLPPGFSPDQWKTVQQAAKARGLDLPGAEFEPTLQHLHYAKLALDDMKRGGMQRGTGAGGVRYNEAKAIGSAQGALLKIMDEHSPDYAKARAQFADNKSLENASELGSEHWTRDPAEANALLKDMSPAEQKIYRDNAFDKWATRVENGPENVGKAQAKSLNQKRLRLLFPDDASFKKFQEGLKQEATMYATDKSVLGGSITADKMADMANDAGITIPEILHAASGRVMPLVKGVATRALKAASTESSEKVAAERARLLTAGAGGDATVRQGAIQKMAKHRPGAPSTAPVVAGGLLGAISATQQRP